MRIPFDLLAALLALETVRELYAKNPAWYWFETTSGEAVLALCCFWVLSWLLYEWAARRTEWAIRWGNNPSGSRLTQTAEGHSLAPPRRHPMETHARLATAAQVLSVVMYVGFIFAFAWPQKTQDWMTALVTPGPFAVVAGSQFIGGILDLGPFAVAMLLALLPRHRVLHAELGRKTRIWKWLSFELRLTFPPLVLWFAFYACMDLAALVLPEQTVKAVLTQSWLTVLLGAGVLVVFALAIMPWLMVRLWHARPMEDTELHARMQALLRRSGVKARAILEWGPGGTGFANACVLGPWAPFRYILISPGLMRLLSPEECEAVIAHEIGHVRHGHLGLLVFVILGLAAFSDLILRGMKLIEIEGPIEQSAMLMLLIVIYLRLLFGFVMRRCERQSDLSSAELMGTPTPLITALEKLALLSGNIREVYSWHHDSIARRVERLAALGSDPEAMQRYHKSLRRMRWGLLGFSFVSVALMLTMALKYPEESEEMKREDTPAMVVIKQDERAGRS